MSRVLRLSMAQARPRPTSLAQRHPRQIPRQLAVALLLVVTMSVAQAAVSRAAGRQSAGPQSTGPQSAGPQAAESSKREAPADRLSSAEIAQAQQLGQSLGIADWLGPLAPVALSPFFGITCLSAMALYGGGWVSADNPFLGEASPLNNQAVFVVFLILTVFTSLPRLTKVSKPFAQAIDQVEAWAGIITMLVLRLLLQQEEGGPAAAMVTPQTVLVAMSPLTFTVNTLLAIAAVINVFVINTVKFFFEVLIWITPVPAIDALFEVANKTLCAALMAVYGLSPTLATVINLVLFLIAAVMFRWVYRRQTFFRTMLTDACRALVSPPKVCPQEIIVFPDREFGPFAARTRCRLQRGEDGWRLVQAGWLSRDAVLELRQQDYQLQVEPGYFTNGLRVQSLRETDGASGMLTFSRLHHHQLPALAEHFRASLPQQDVQPHGRTALRAELS